LRVDYLISPGLRLFYTSFVLASAATARLGAAKMLMKENREYFRQHGPMLEAAIQSAVQLVVAQPMKIR